MIELAEARKIATRMLRDLEGVVGTPLCLDEGRIVRTRHFVVFPYDSCSYLKAGSFSDALAGNAPIVVDLRDGKLVDVVANQPVSEQLAGKS